MAETILVVDDDPDIARFVEVNLRSAGYDVAVAGDGEEALERAGDLRPDLVLLDVMMPRIDGFEVAQRLRKNPHTANTSIIMLTAKALSADKVTGLQSGADDYIIKPFDPIELLARVKGTLRRAKEMRNLSPLTGLPGNIRIQDEIERQVREGHPFAVLYCDLDNFKAYNDQKGFVRGDRLIQATARIIQDAVAAHDGRTGSSDTSGGDDFVAVVDPEIAEDVAQLVCERFDEARAAVLRARGHSSAGFVRVEDRKGVLQDIPLVSVSIGVATSSHARVRPLRRGRRGGDRDEAVRQARHRLLVRDRPAHHLSYAPRPGSRAPSPYTRPIETACFRGGVQFPTGGDSPRPHGRQPWVDPVRFRDRP